MARNFGTVDFDIKLVVIPSDVCPIHATTKQKTILKIGALRAGFKWRAIRISRARETRVVFIECADDLALAALRAAIFANLTQGLGWRHKPTFERDGFIAKAPQELSNEELGVDGYAYAVYDGNVCERVHMYPKDYATSVRKLVPTVQEGDNYTGHYIPYECGTNLIGFTNGQVNWVAGTNQPALSARALHNLYAKQPEQFTHYYVLGDRSKLPAALTVLDLPESIQGSWLMTLGVFKYIPEIVYVKPERVEVWGNVVVVVIDKIRRTLVYPEGLTYTAKASRFWPAVKVARSHNGLYLRIMDNDDVLKAHGYVKGARHATD